MIVLCFDLSTTSTGVVEAKLKDNSLASLSTFSIVPDKSSPTEIGYLTMKKKMHRGDRSYTSFVKYKSEEVSYTTKKKRDREFRLHRNKKRLDFISAAIAKVVKKIEPDVILYEKNMMFNSITTTEQLAKLAGILLGVAASCNTQVIEFNINKVRASYDMVNMVQSFVRGKDAEELRKAKDITKAAIKEVMCAKYSISKDVTLDESDALLIFDYWKSNYFKGEKL